MRHDSRGWFSVASLDLPDRVLLSAVVLLPWAFGGIEIWAYRLAGLLAVVAATLRVGLATGPDWRLRRIRFLLVPAILLLALALLQLMPLPPSLLARLSPKAHALYVTTFPGYATGQAGDPIAGLEAQALAQVPEVDGIPDPRAADEPLSTAVGGRWDGWRPVSLAPALTLERIFWYVPLLITFLMFHAGSRDAERRRVFQAVLFLNFLALALFGLVFMAIGNDKLYWIRSTVQDTNPFGPYVNPTNFAAVMELAVPWVLAAAWSAHRLKRRSALPFPILLATGACCLLAGMLSGSRAAVVLMIAAIAAVALVVQQNRRTRLLLSAGFAGVAASGSVLAALTGLGGRFARFFELGSGGLADVERLAAWRAAWTMLRDFPLTGAGIGAFREVFPIYAPAGGDARMRHLHNDYFEVVVETGWFGALLLVGLTFAFVWLAVSSSKRNLTANGLLIGLACLFVHAAVDFNHQIPANALLFVAAAGMVVSREQPE